MMLFSEQKFFVDCMWIPCMKSQASEALFAQFFIVWDRAHKCELWNSYRVLLASMHVEQ